MADPDVSPPPPPPRSSWGKTILLMLVALVVLGFYFTVLPGLSVARKGPSRIETEIATFLLRQSVPAEARAKPNPLGANPDPAEISAGHELYTSKCQVCHGYDGTQIGGASFPRAPVLKDGMPSLSDGEVFYHIRNGIPNTAMPAWDLPDHQIWQLVSYLRHLPKAAAPEGHG